MSGKKNRKAPTPAEQYLEPAEQYLEAFETAQGGGNGGKNYTF